LDVSEFLWYDGYLDVPESLAVINGYLCAVSLMRRGWCWAVATELDILKSGLTPGIGSVRTAKIRSVCGAYQLQPGPVRQDTAVLEAYLRAITAAALHTDSTPRSLFSAALEVLLDRAMFCL